MRAVFLDYATVSHRDDLDPSRLAACAAGARVASADGAGRCRPGDRRRRRSSWSTSSGSTREAIAATPTLKLVALAATGTNNVDLDAARERGVAVCNLRDYCTASVVQHVLGVLLLLTHRLREYDALVRSGAWQKGEQFCLLEYPIRELCGRRFGIVGYGTLGQSRRARRRRPSAWSSRSPTAPAARRSPGGVNLAELLPTVDVLSLHCPLTPATAGLIGASQLASMKPDAVLINTARGALVDAQALAAALRAGRLGGAAIDVLPQEPPVDGDPLLAPDIPNLIVTPHVAWARARSAPALYRRDGGERGGFPAGRATRAGGLVRRVVPRGEDA